MSDHDIVHINLNTNTISMNDYRIVSDTLAEVVVSCTGDMNKDERAIALSKLFNEDLSPVQGSFTWLSDGVATGFVSLAPAVQVVEGDSQLASYKQLASNMYMDEQDDSLWEMREGAGGKYLVRQSKDELPAILASTKAPRRAGIPSLSSVVRAAAKENELVSFIHGDALDHGVCIGKSKTNGYPVVLSTNNPRQPVAVDPRLIVSTSTIDMSRFEDVLRVTAALPDPSTVIDYWNRVFNHDPEYMAKLIENVEQQAAV